jgi:putative transposase
VVERAEVGEAVHQTFTSAILPRYLRRVPGIAALIPTLYLKRVSTGDFTDALTAILGEKASGLWGNGRHGAI